MAKMRSPIVVSLLLVAVVWALHHDACCDAFVVPHNNNNNKNPLSLVVRPLRPRQSSTTTCLRAMAPPRRNRRSGRSGSLDLVTYLRTEWVSAALFTNQTPRSADVVLQLGCHDGRMVTFVPRTVRQLVTSTATPDGQLTVAVRRQLQQQHERRFRGTLLAASMQVRYVNQRADELRETADESVDVVVSMTAAAQLLDQGLDWKKSIREAGRVLKPGGRLLFVEQTELEGESYVDYVANLVTLSDGPVLPENEAERVPIFDMLGVDDVDMVLVPHIAGVAIKSELAGMTPAERAKMSSNEEKERLADRSIEAYERGIKKRRKKKKTAAGEPEQATTKT
jgi:SAM-dependent methyltransferase